MQETVPSAPLDDSSPKRTSTFDRVMTVAVWVLVLVVVGLGSWFAYSVWLTNNTENVATPAMRAINLIKEEVRKNPNSAELRVRLGEALATAGLDDQAVEQLGDAIKLNPKHVGAYLDLGIVAMDQKQTAQAEQYFKKVVDLTEGQEYAQLSQQRENALYYLGQIMAATNRPQDAVSYYKAALRIKRDSSDTYFNLALAYKALGAFDQAIKQLEIAIAFDPNYAQAHFEMAENYLALKDYVNASYQLKIAEKLAPEADPVKEAIAALGPASEWTGKAEKALAARDFSAAADAILVAEQLDPKDVAIRKVHAKIAEGKGDKKAALKIWKEALKLAPKDAEVKAAVARLGGK